ncbi:hypothetical protein ACWGRF_35340 [Streptomyces zhihengii]
MDAHSTRNAARAAGRGGVLCLLGLGLSACTLTAPDPPDHGFRTEGADLVVAYPICPSEEVHGASIAVSRDEGGFETLWRATGPRDAAVRGGEFVVGSDRSFAAEDKGLAGSLPDEFFVETVVTIDGGVETGDDGSVDLRKLRGAEPGPGEYMTWSGEVMTRAEINAQRRCGAASPSGG